MAVFTVFFIGGLLALTPARRPQQTGRESGEGTVTTGKQEEAWRRFASEIGADFVESRYSKLGPFRWKASSDEVVAEADDWIVRLDTYSVGSSRGSTTYTRMTASCSAKDWFRFEVYRGDFGKIGKLLGMQDIEVGVPEFDPDLVIKGDDESKVRALLASKTVRQLIQAQPTIHLQTKEGVLQFNVPGVIEDVERLKSLHQLFTETLRQLRKIDAIN